MKYLNLSGLSYFLNKIKTYLTSSTYLNSIGISNSDIDDIADDAGYSSGSLPASEDIFITGDIIPNTDNSVDLGASSKNIKMVYTKGITINGTQFLPSDVVHKSGNETVGGVKTFESNPFILKDEPRLNLQLSTYIKGELPSKKMYQGVGFFDTYGGNVGFFGLQTSDTGYNVAYMRCSNSIINDDGSKTERTYNVGLRVSNDDKDIDFQPSTDSTVNLGTSTSKWKTINGINPGALSLQGTGAIDISSNITVLDGTAPNKFTPQINGWLHINGTGLANDAFIYAVQGRVGMKSANNQTSLRCAVVIPVVAGAEVAITCKLGTLTWANITPCQGNV